MDTPDMIENGSAPDDADQPGTRSRTPQWVRDLFSTEPLAVVVWATQPDLQGPFDQL